MIKLFDANETNFTSNGNTTIQPLKCIETRKKSLNDWFIDVEVPIEYKDFIEKDKLCLVKVKSNVNPQAFRIRKEIERTRNGIKFKAYHVLFDAYHYFINAFSTENLSALTALNGLLEHTDVVNPFTISSDVMGDVTLNFELISLLESFSLIETTIGGFFDADNFHLSFKSSIGLDRGETLIYGKNLNNVRVFEDWESVVTRVYPVGKDKLRLPELYRESTIKYDLNYVKKIEFDVDNVDDLRTSTDTYLSVSQYPKVSYELNADINQILELGDTIHVKHPLVNIITDVQEYEFNVNTQKLIKLVFGNFVRDLNNPFSEIKTSVKEVIKRSSFQEQMLIDQMNTINNLNKNGYIYLTDNELMIGDSLPVPSAANIWRWGLGGLGFSPNGIEGPFTTAITYDGKINADFILAGLLKGIIMEIGTDNAIFKANGYGLSLGHATFASAPFSVDMLGSLKATKGLIASWNLLSDRMYAGSGTTYVGISPGLFSGSKYYSFWAGNATPSSAPFSVTRAGELFAESGKIGSWNLLSDRLYAGSGSDYVGISMGILSSSKYYSFWAGNSNPSSAPFGVTRDGYVRMTSGRIGGFDFTTDGLTAFGPNVISLDTSSGEIGINGAYLLASDSTAMRVSTNLIPKTINNLYLGNSTYRWAGLWVNGGLVTSSDKRLKKNIKSIDQADEFIFALNPVQYKLKNGKRNHFGFIAQDVKKTLDQLDMDSGIFVDPTIKPDWNVNKPGENRRNHYLALRYEEFIPPMVSVLQSINKRLNELERRI